jgi:hypothetical protein
VKLKHGKKSGLVYLSYSDIRGWGPCYDPKKYVPDTWRGTAVDILRLTSVPHADRLWVVLRTELVSERVMRLFAVWCARQVQHLMKDERSLKALDVAEAFANGNATREELSAARAAAGAAAWDAARDAAWDAARDAAWAAARDAARAAARDAARAAARAAARDAARDAQIAKLIEMVGAEGKERVAAKGLGERIRALGGHDAKETK